MKKRIPVPVLLALLALFVLACICGSDTQTLIIVQATPIPPTATPTPTPTPITEVMTTKFECESVRYEIEAVGPATTSCPGTRFFDPSVTLYDGRIIILWFREEAGHHPWFEVPFASNGFLEPVDELTCYGHWDTETPLISTEIGIIESVETPVQITCTGKGVSIKALIFRVSYSGRFLWWHFTDE